MTLVDIVDADDEVLPVDPWAISIVSVDVFEGIPHGYSHRVREVMRAGRSMGA
jgi:urease gamma subunit